MTTPAGQIALIRTIVEYAEGHEERALAEVSAILAGATIMDLLRTRLGGAA